MKEFDPIHAAAHGYTREDWDAVESPELTDEELARARPMREAMPELHAAIVETIARRETASSGSPVSVRLDPDVLAKFEATGEGWEALVNEVLRRANIKEIVREESRSRGTGVKHA